MDSGKWKATVRALMICAVLSLWAPVLWIGIISANDAHDWGDSITRYGHYGLAWPLLTWAATIPLTAGGWTAFVLNGDLARLLTVGYAVLLVCIFLFIFVLATPDTGGGAQYGGFFGLGRNNRTQ